MHAPTRVLVLAGALALAATATLTACGGSEPAGDPSSFVDVSGSGSAAPVADEVTALCAQIVEQKLDQDTADALADASGFTTRVVEIDGAPQPATADYREDRMSFSVQDGVVVDCTVG